MQQKKFHLGLFLAGLLLLLLFFAQSMSVTGMTLTFAAQLGLTFPGSLNFWLAHTLLACPGGILIGMALHHWAQEKGGKLWQNLQSMKRREWLMAGVLLGIFWFALARVGREWILLNFPVTDDENAVTFAAQALVSGHLLAPIFKPLHAFPTRFLIVRAGGIASIDWPGPILASTVNEWLGIKAFVHSIFAALTAVIVAWIAHQRMGREGAFWAATFFLFSPMALTLSMTEHSHVISRGFLAAFLLAYLWAEQPSSRWRWFVVGGLLGLAICTRPFESAAIALPFALYRIYLLHKQETRKQALLSIGFVALGLFLPMLFFAFFNHQITGTFWLPARFAEGRLHNVDYTGHGFLRRLGGNVSTNMLLVSIFFLGPLGGILAAIGLRRGHFEKLLGFSVLSIFLLGLAHSDFGVHVVGPLHYADSVIPLTLLASAGWLELRSYFTNSQTLLPWSGMIAGYLLVAMVSFQFWHLSALRAQAEVNAGPYHFLERSGIKNAVVLTPLRHQYWAKVQKYFWVRSCVVDWRPPHPNLSNKILLVRDHPKYLPLLRKVFPHRKFYRLHIHRRQPHLTLQPL